LTTSIGECEGVAGVGIAISQREKET